MQIYKYSDKSDLVLELGGGSGIFSLMALFYKRNAIYVDKTWEFCEFFSMYLNTVFQRRLQAYCEPRELPDDLLLRDASDHDNVIVGSIPVSEVKYQLSPLCFAPPVQTEDLALHLLGLEVGIGCKQIDKRALNQLNRPRKIFQPFFVSPLRLLPYPLYCP